MTRATTRAKTMDTRLAALEGSVQEIQSSVATIGSTMQNLSAVIASMESRFSALEFHFSGADRPHRAHADHGDSANQVGGSEETLSDPIAHMGQRFPRQDSSGDDDIPAPQEKYDDDDDDIPAPLEKYDVFISFRGEDTRNTFTSHLHAALLRKKIETYIDYRLVRGGEIAPALLEAIEKSMLSLVIFSQNYASSTWCLDELAHILHCREKYGQLVIPIFYGTGPSTVRKQKGSYEVAFAQHEKRFKGAIGKVNVWRAALTTAANLSGFSNETGTEADLVTEVVNEIWSQLNRKSSSVLKGLVGMERCIHEIESSLCIDSLDVYTVGIWGMGGIGKTTLADAVFHRLSSKFEASCFLENVREKSAKDGLVHLRNTLLSEILKENDLNIGTPTIGSDLVRKRMGSTKVLIVLDDVSDSKQLNFLAGDPALFGPGSRVIITTRDKSLLQKSVEHKIYEVQELNSDEAFQLFHLSAFGNNISRVDCAELSKLVVDYCGGIPLALQILGSSFLQCESKEDWLDEWKEFPREKIWKVLRSSYDGLKEIEKEIFLDIACFYQGKDVYIVKEMLDICGFRASVIGALIDKSLISISTNNSLQMHNLLQEMGRSIVREQCIEEPEKCNRLFVDEDFNRELKTNTGSATLQAIFFNRSAIKGILLDHADFENMYDLRLLYVYNSSRNKYCNVKVSLPHSLTYLDWEGYPFKSLPSKLCPENLVELQMRNSQVEQLWNEGQNLMKLRVMDLGLSRTLMKVPDLSRSPNIEHINLSGTAIESLPESIGNLKSLEKLDLSGTVIKCLPASIKEASRLISLQLTNCRSLESLPELPGVRWLQAHGCTSLKQVLSSKTALTLGWDEYKNSQGLQEQLTFSNCIEMGWDAWCDSQFRIMRMATALSKHFKQEDIEVASHLEFEEESKEYVFRSPVCVVCPGNIIPRWFSYEVDKSLLWIKLGPNFFDTNFLGFAYSVVVAFKNYNVGGSLRVGCKINFKGYGDHCIYHQSCMVAEYGEINESKFETPHVCIWFSTFDHLKQGSFNGVTKAIFDFYPIIDDCPDGGVVDYSMIKVTKCGIFPMYAPVVDLILASRMKQVRELNVEAHESFPHLVDLMFNRRAVIGNLKFLDLRGTAIKNLPASIGNLKSLEKLDLSGTAIKCLPASIGNLKSLEKLDLSGTAIKCLPESIGNLKSLEKLDLSGTVIKCLPASIKEASRLISLQLTNCRSLESLPELPGVRWLQAHGCTSLKQVLSSKTALTLGWDEYKNSQGLQEQLTFSNCIEMGWDAWCDSQFRIMRMATALSKHFKQEDIEVASHLEFEEESKEYVFRSPVCVVCPGNIIPRWFSYEVDKSLLWIKLGPNFFDTNFLGFAYSVVVAFKNYNVGGSLRVGCKINFKGYGDHCIYHQSCMVAEYGEINESKFETPHVCIWFSTFDHLKQGSFNGVTKAIFDFYPIIDDCPDGGVVDYSMIKVTKCGIFPMYAPVVDLILASRMKQVRELNVEAHESFPHLVDLMFNRRAVIGNLKFLDLRGTAIKNLPASIGNLKSLEKLDLSGTAIKCLPASIGNLKSLEKLDLSGTAIKCLPESIGNLKSLEKLDLSGTVIKCLPASIKEASRLISLQLTNCRSLESLPELPGVRWLQAHGCTSLKQVLSSKTALTLGWDEYKNSQGLQEQLTYSNCKGMGWDAWRDIVTDSQIRIMRMATALSKYFTQEEIKVAFHLEFEEESNEYVFKSPVCIVCPGSAIPRWFPNEVDKSVLRIELGSNFFNANFLGFAYSVVVAFKNYNVGGSLRVGCKINFKDSCDHRVHHRSCMVAEYGEINECKFETPHVFIWFSTFDHVKQGSYNGVTEAIVDFYPMTDDLPDGRAVDCSKIKVTRCGVFPINARYMWFSCIGNWSSD
ncbi:disease resistance protein RUN1-like isoform X7 [Malus sylvestris]|uniref:disease resistance protein RUN1-like isoform X7 n=1 Tax=Malus sylvestris TaxID=3752 RepID=UPI0021AC2DE8|nr:disease resistance protein RUN1-like isoform X7 [Malus sylvestris]